MRFCLPLVLFIYGFVYLVAVCTFLGLLCCYWFCLMILKELFGFYSWLFRLGLWSLCFSLLLNFGFGLLVVCFDRC